MHKHAFKISKSPILSKGKIFVTRLSQCPLQEEIIVTGKTCSVWKSQTGSYHLTCENETTKVKATYNYKTWLY